ncbi:MAG: hypothetical protein LBQ30_05900 [Treponema sp.]|jgi:hypothetical protein|nr:hypothetical protein [Treponema sp.]
MQYRNMVAGIVLCISLAAMEAAAQEDAGFGFGFEDEPDSLTAAVGPRAQVSGEVKAQLLGFGDDFSSEDRFKQASLGDVFSGKLNFSASAFNAEGVMRLRLAPIFDGSGSPLSIDEAYVRAYFGKLDLEGGLRKLTWGKADSFGPLDVLNPLDYTDLSSMTDLLGMKIARPLIHVSYRLGSFSKLEGVFVPWFAGHRFASAGRWAPAQVTSYPDLIKDRITNAITGIQKLPTPPPNTHPDLTDSSGDGIRRIQDYYGKIDIPSLYPLTSGLEYAQAGLRFTTTVGSSDVGVQYFFGNLFRPAITVTGEDTFLQNPYGIQPNITYNRYHQIGADYAQVIAGFNLRAELAANITSDLSGDDGAVYNPAIAWSLGFDRDLVWGINLNLQALESIRLLHDKVADQITLDTEAGTDMTQTRITGILSKKLFREELEIKLTGMWGIEDKDFLILPALIWTKGAVEVELSGGIFGGDEQGELGQYRKNSFVKAGLTYAF